MSNPLESWTEEQRSAFLYRVCAEAEAGTARADLFARLAGEAEAQAAIWRAQLTASGKRAPPPFVPDLRTRLVARLVRLFGPGRLRGVLAAMKVRGMAIYTKGEPGGHVVGGVPGAWQTPPTRVVPGGQVVGGACACADVAGPTIRARAATVSAMATKAPKKARVARGNDRHQCRGRPPGGQQPASPVRHPEPLSEPVDNRELQLVRSGRNRPHAGEEVVPRRQPVAHHRWKRRNARYVTEEMRMRLASMIWKHPLGELRERGVEADALLRGGG